MIDPRFPGGNTNPEGIECQLIDRPKFPEKCIKVKKIGPKEARPKFDYVNLPLRMSRTGFVEFKVIDLFALRLCGHQYPGAVP